MKTREQIYGQEAAGILRDVSMYRALTEMQLLKLYPHKESKIRNLLSYHDAVDAAPDFRAGRFQHRNRDQAYQQHKLLDNAASP